LNRKRDELLSWSTSTINVIIIIITTTTVNNNDNNNSKSKKIRFVSLLSASSWLSYHIRGHTKVLLSRDIILFAP
jgi:hypothetical protein